MRQYKEMKRTEREIATRFLSDYEKGRPAIANRPSSTLFSDV